MDGGGACYCGRDDVAWVGAPFSIVSNLGVGAAIVDGTAHALGCTAKALLFPIRKVNSGMRFVREGRLKDGHSRDHLCCGEDGKGEDGIP
jgi:hypothetical protein